MKLSNVSKGVEGRGVELVVGRGREEKKGNLGREDRGLYIPELHQIIHSDHQNLARALSGRESGASIHSRAHSR